MFFLEVTDSNVLRVFFVEKVHVSWCVCVLVCVCIHSLICSEISRSAENPFKKIKPHHEQFKVDLQRILQIQVQHWPCLAASADPSHVPAADLCLASCFFSFFFVVVDVVAYLQLRL
jgi:hypothetical protein